MSRHKEHIAENICYLVYCKNRCDNNQIVTLAFFIEPSQIDNEEKLLYDRGLKGIFYDFYRIKIINESKYLDYVKLLTVRQHFTYLASKDVYIL